VSSAIILKRPAGWLPLLGRAPQGRAPRLPRELPGPRRLHPRRRL